MKHNKKRNIAFVYEALIREATKAVINKESSQKTSTIFDSKYLNDHDEKMMLRNKSTISIDSSEPYFKRIKHESD